MLPLSEVSSLKLGVSCSLASLLHFSMGIVATSRHISECLPVGAPQPRAPLKDSVFSPLQHSQSSQLLKCVHVWAKHINLSICLYLPFQESIAIVTWYSDKRLEMRMEQGQTFSFLRMEDLGHPSAHVWASVTARSTFSAASNIPRVWPQKRDLGNLC